MSNRKNKHLALDKSGPKTDEPQEMIKQNSNYTDHNQAANTNDIFFENKSNPLSSKGN